ncbi:MAG: hypothetical protein NT027_16245 [Proteobacteria bacterium]|nr:hypothetical protein [Pseudomonadota bacterium]
MTMKTFLFSQCSTRRRFLEGSILTALTMSLAKTLWAREAFLQPTSSVFEKWLLDLLAAGERLRTGQISTEVWQSKVDQLYGAVSLGDLKAHIDFDRLTENFNIPSAGEKFIDLDPMTGKPFETPPPEIGRVVTKLAGVKRGLNVPPHGHENTVSAFLVLLGSFRVQQFDKIQTKANSLVFKKSRDEIQTPGFWSSTSESTRNMHWLTALSQDSFFFSTKINAYLPGRPVKGRVNVDLRRPIDHGSDIMEAKIISDRLAHEIYNG